MAKTRIGLDIGSTAVRVAEVEQSARPTVLRLGQVPLPPGAVEAGEVNRPDIVAETLRRLIEVSGIRATEVHLGISTARVVAREVSIPWLPEKEIRAAIGFQMQDFIPMPAAEAVLDFQLRDERQSDGQRVQDLLLVAAPRTSVTAHISAVEQAGLVPVGIDFSPLAAVRATAGEDASTAEALVDIGGDITCIALHRGTAVRLVRVLGHGGREVTKAIAGSLQMTVDLAEVVKRGESDAATLQGIDRGRAHDAALEAARPLIEEIASTIEFSLRQMPDLAVARLTVTGGGSHLDGIVELLGARMGLAVERAKVFGRTQSRLATELGEMAESGGTFAVAVGLALPDEARHRGGRAA